MRDINNATAGFKTPAGLSYSTSLPTLDFETYSEAGFFWNGDIKKWIALPQARHRGLKTVGVVNYSLHLSTEILSLAYDLKQGDGIKLWKPSDKFLPYDLFQYVNNGGLLEAWNSSFEYHIWKNIAINKYDFPFISLSQFRCAMAKARAFALPGALDDSAAALNLDTRKNADGKRLLAKFSIPHTPTKIKPILRDYPENAIEDAMKLYAYNAQDVAVESAISSKVPDLNYSELTYWLLDQTINAHGVQVDIKLINACIKIWEKCEQKYNSELALITDGLVTRASYVQRLQKWLYESESIFLPTLDSHTVAEALKNELTSKARRVLEIRELIALSSVKKLYAIRNRATSDGRLHDLFIYHSARTGRAAGAGPQPQNLPNSGLETVTCSCGISTNKKGYCPNCLDILSTQREAWKSKQANAAIEVLSRGDLEIAEHFYDNIPAVISACLRGVFIAKPGYDLICSDFSAIEAVVLAALAREQWRLDVFRTHGKIYEMSASKITGVPFSEFEQYYLEHGQHHPLRKKVGKVAELASGYQGWIGAWKQFGADKFFTEEEMKATILAWRRASPAIVEMWGGQPSYRRNEYWGLEGAAVQAVLNPGITFGFNAIRYVCENDILYCTLLSGRNITYHQPRLIENTERGGLSLSFMGHNTNVTQGKTGWSRMSTYGGKLTENVVQATARDILMYALVNLQKAGYEIVLHVHDEAVAEIQEGSGSIEEFERIMSTPPAWASTWPIRASGGWRAKRYGKN